MNDESLFENIKLSSRLELEAKGVPTKNIDILESLGLTNEGQKKLASDYDRMEEQLLSDPNKKKVIDGVVEEFRQIEVKRYDKPEAEGGDYSL